LKISILLNMVSFFQLDSTISPRMRKQQHEDPIQLRRTGHLYTGEFL